MAFLAEQTTTDQLCVTRGKDGAVLLFENACYYNKGYQVKVADTVGAGDSFLASIVSQLLNGSPPQYAINFACAVGSLVASKSGANPELGNGEILGMMEGSLP